MATRSKLSTKGFEAYLEKVMEAGANINDVADEALLAGGNVLLDGMERRVPKDTGNLQEHLEITGPEQHGNVHIIEVGMSRRADKETARYGNAQEYGTPSMAAQPYIRPTIDEDSSKAKRAMRKVFKKRATGVG